MKILRNFGKSVIMTQKSKTYVYIIIDMDHRRENRSTSLLDYYRVHGYVGITNDLQRRIKEHKQRIKTSRGKMMSTDKLFKEFFNDDGIHNTLAYRDLCSVWDNRNIANLEFKLINSFDNRKEALEYEAKMRPYPFIGDNKDMGGHVGSAPSPIYLSNKQDKLSAWDASAWFLDNPGTSSRDITETLVKSKNALVHGAHNHSCAKCHDGLIYHYEQLSYDEQKAKTWTLRSEDIKVIKDWFTIPERDAKELTQKLTEYERAIKIMPDYSNLIFNSNIDMRFNEMFYYRE